MLPFSGLSVTFVHCAQTAECIDTISVAYDSPMSLPDRVNLAYIGQLLPPHILPQSGLPPVDLNVGGKLRPNGQR